MSQAARGGGAAWLTLGADGVLRLASEAGAAGARQEVLLWASKSACPPGAAAGAPRLALSAQGLALVLCGDGSALDPRL